MAKTVKTTKTTKSTMKTRTPRPSRVARAVENAVETADRNTQNSIEMVKDMATKSLHLGLGLGAYLLDRPRNVKFGPMRGNFRENIDSIVTSAINKGQKIEQEQLGKLMNFEREQRQRVKAFLAARKRELQRTEATLEQKIEEVIASLDIPTRSDIHQLNRRLNELSKELARQRVEAPKAKTAKSTKKAVSVETKETKPAAKRNKRNTVKVEAAVETQNA